MHQNVQFEVAIRKWLRLSEQMSVSAPTSTTSTTPTSSTSSHPPARGAPLPDVGDRLRIADWPALDIDDDDADELDPVRKTRLAVQSCVADCLGHEVALSTLKSYQSVLYNTLRAAEAELQEELLPITNEDQLMKIFAFLSVSEGKSLQWAQDVTGGHCEISCTPLPGVTV